MKKLIFITIFLTLQIALNAQLQYFELKKGQVFKTELEDYENSILVCANISCNTALKTYIITAEVYKDMESFLAKKHAIGTYNNIITFDSIKKLNDNDIKFFEIKSNGGLGFTPKALQIMLNSVFDGERLAKRWKISE